jgi:adenylate cyclase class 2
MKTEIEVKFLNVDFDELRKKLVDFGGVCEQPMRLMKRALSETPEMRKDGRDAFLRLRDQGDKVTLTFKEFKSLSLSGAHEHEVEVSDFDTMLEIMKESGLPPITFQESKRETWRLDDVEIVLDEWPWLNTYIEIEAESEGAVRDMAAKLGFSWNNAVFGSVDEAYAIQYPHMKGRGVIDLKEVRFGDPLPDIFKV